MKKNTLEWTVFGLSLALIAGIVILLVHEHLAGENRPPSIAANVGEAVATSGGYAVPIDVRNDGDTTAEEVQVEGSLTWEGGSERGEAVLSFVPYRSERRAWIAFSHDPRNGKLEVRVVGYREP